MNHGGTPESKLADVEFHFEEGLLSGLKLVGCSVWRARKGEEPSVLIPSRSYATAGGVRYYDLLRPSAEGTGADEAAARLVVRNLKQYLRDEYRKIAALPEEGHARGKKTGSGER